MRAQGLISRSRATAKRTPRLSAAFYRHSLQLHLIESRLVAGGPANPYLMLRLVTYTPCQFW